MRVHSWHETKNTKWELYEALTLVAVIEFDGIEWIWSLSSFPRSGRNRALQETMKAVCAALSEEYGEYLITTTT